MLSPITGFASPTDLQRWYQAALDELSIGYEYRTIETSFGDTQVIQAGPAGRPPLVLLHDAPGCAPLALRGLADLVPYFRIYAIDIVGQPNRSEAIRPALSGDAYAQWLYEILSRLRVRQATLVGHGFGGFLAGKILAFDARHLARAVLIAPAGIVRGNPVRVFHRVLLPWQRYRRYRRSRYLDQYLATQFTAPPDRLTRSYYAQALLQQTGGMPRIPLLHPETAHRIRTPLSIVAAADDLLYPGERLLARARALFPALERTVLLPRSRHVPGPEDYGLIEALIRD